MVPSSLANTAALHRNVSYTGAHVECRRIVFVDGIMLFNQRFSLTKRRAECIVNGSLFSVKTGKL
jgi:hypothetical protein